MPTYCSHLVLVKQQSSSLDHLSELFPYICSCCWGLPGSWWAFGSAHADIVQKPAGHLLSVGGGDEAWNETVPPSTGDGRSLLCWPNVSMKVGPTAVLVTLSPCVDHIKRSRSASIEHVFTYMTQWYSVESVAQLLCDCCSSDSKATARDPVRSTSWCPLA